MAEEIRTEIEIQLGVDVKDVTYAPGDARRYGAASDSVTDCTPAIVVASQVREAMKQR
jgi:hypothetical protein